MTHLSPRLHEALAATLDCMPNVIGWKASQNGADTIDLTVYRIGSEAESMHLTTGMSSADVTLLELAVEALRKEGSSMQISLHPYAVPTVRRPTIYSRDLKQHLRRQNELALSNRV